MNSTSKWPGPGAEQHAGSVRRYMVVKIQREIRGDNQKQPAARMAGADRQVNSRKQGVISGLGVRLGVCDQYRNDQGLLSRGLEWLCSIPAGPSSSSPILCVSPHFPLIHNVRLLLACRISPWSSCTDLAAIGRVSGVWYGTSEHAL